MTKLERKERLVERKSRSSKIGLGWSGLVDNRGLDELLGKRQ